MSLRYKTSFRFPALVAVLCFLLIAENAFAGTVYPKFTGSIDVDVQYDDTYDADDETAGFSGFYTTTSPALALEFHPGLMLSMNGEMEALTEARASHAADDYGLRVEELHLSYDSGRFSLLGGKFAPVFATGWNDSSGIYDSDFTDDYQIDQQIGLQGTLSLNNGLPGTHRFSIGTFFVDTTFLGASGIDDRKRVKKSDGGVGNTENFSSFAMALNGGELAWAPGFSYHLGHIRRAAGQGDVTDETAYAIAGRYQAKAGQVLLTASTEFVHFDDFGGARDLDRDYSTAGLRLGWNSISLSVSGTTRRTDGDDDDRLLQFSAAYEFDIGMTLDLGWKRTDEDGDQSDTVGIFLTYGLKF